MTGSVMDVRTAWVSVGLALGSACLLWSAGCSCNNDDDDDVAATDSDGSTSSATDPSTTTETESDVTSGVTTDPISSTGETETATITPTTVGLSTGSTGDPNINCGDGTVAIGEVCFGQAMRIETAPTGVVALGDFYDDGGLDIAAGQNGAVSFYNGNGAGTFDAADIIPTGSGVLGLAVGDFNGDTIDDVAYSDSGSNQVNIMIGGGAVPVPGTAVDVGAFPRGMVVGDFGGDTSLDLAVVSEDAGEVTILLGDGSGGLTVDQVLTAGSAPLAIATGDINGGGLDLMAANFGGNTISVFFAEMMAFGPEQSYPAQSGPRGLVFADFDGDDVSDLVAVHQESNSVGLWLGANADLGSPTFTMVSGTPRGVDGADFDGDDVTDVAVALESANAFGVLRGEASGLAVMQTFAALPRPDAIAAGLLDDDSAPDVVVASSGDNGGIAVVFADP